MSIADQITRLQGVKTDILTSIGNKGIDVPSGSMLEDCPSLIASINVGTTETDTQVKVGSTWYRKTTIGNLVWMAEPLREIVGEPGNLNDYVLYQDRSYIKEYGVYYARDCFTFQDGSPGKFASMIPQGWRLPTLQDVDYLKSYVGTTTSDRSKLMYKLGYTGYGLDVYKAGIWQSTPTGGQFVNVGSYDYIMTSNITGDGYYVFSISDSYATGGNGKNNKSQVRLVKDL